MSALSGTLAEVLSRINNDRVGAIELGYIVSIDPFILEHRGEESPSDAIAICAGVTVEPGDTAILAVFGAASRIVIGVLR